VRGCGHGREGRAYGSNRKRGVGKKRIHGDGGELRANYRSGTGGVFFLFFLFFCFALSTNMELCVPVSVFITVYVSKNMSFSGEHHRVGLRRCKIQTWKSRLPYFFFPSPTVRELPSSCQTGSQLNSSDVQIGYSPCFQLLKGDAVLGGGRPPLQQGSEGQSHGSHHKALLHSILHPSPLHPFTPSPLPPFTTNPWVGGRAPLWCLVSATQLVSGSNSSTLGDHRVTQGEEITLPTRPALSQGNCQGTGKGPTVERKSTLRYLHHRKLRLQLSVETASQLSPSISLPGEGVPSPSPLCAFFIL